MARLCYLISDPKDSYSSYDSLDKYNYALETLKLSDNANYFNGNNCMLQPKCRQPYIHNVEQNKTTESITPKLPPRPPLPKSSMSSTTIDKDLAKQQQLSDWYYIKPGPRSPLPAQRKPNGIYMSIKPTSTERIAHNRNDGIYAKSSITPRLPANTGIHETTKNNLNIYNENQMKRGGNTNCQFIGDKCDVQIIDSKIAPTLSVAQHDLRLKQHSIGDSDDNGYHAIGVPPPSLCDNIYTSSNVNHQYSSNDPLCKFDSRNCEKVNGITDKQRLLLLSPPSPSMSQQQKLHKEHPYYYVESQKPSQKPLPSPRQNRKPTNSYQTNNGFSSSSSPPPPPPPSSKSFDRPQCEQTQVPSHRTNSHFYHVPMLSLQQQKQHSQNDDDDDSNGFKHVNVTTTSGFSSLSASSDKSVDECRRKNLTGDSNFVARVATNNNSAIDNRQCLQQTVSSSPLLPHQQKVSKK